MKTTKQIIYLTYFPAVYYLFIYYVFNEGWINLTIYTVRFLSVTRRQL